MPEIYDDDRSEFLVHLTRPQSDGSSAKANLRLIIEFKHLISGGWVEDDYSKSDARFAVPQEKLTPETEREFLKFISFTDVPLKYIRRLFDIPSRKKRLSHYGLVFPKNWLIEKGASPVFYINNAQGDKNELVGVLASLIDTHPKEAAQILPLIAVFRRMLTPKGGKAQARNYSGFLWEREWRLAAAGLSFTEDDVVVGLCPENEIEEFEKLFQPVPFIDARKFKQYKFKLNCRWLKLDRKR